METLQLSSGRFLLLSGTLAGEQKPGKGVAF